MANERAMTREERLAAKLRENLHRRKAQARALAGGGQATAAGEATGGESPASLPKEPPTR